MRERALVVGAGGLGSPAALLLARSGLFDLTVIDDDVIDVSNLHRQVLYAEADVGRSKPHTARAALEREARARGHAIDVRAIEGRLVPDDALELVREHSLVIEGADNFATKFLAADAAMLARVPVVHAGVVRWAGYALAVVPGESACLRCVFEDIPRDRVETCAEAGVIGPVVGALGGVQAALAIRLALGDRAAAGALWRYDARAAKMRATRVSRRASCALCGVCAEIEDLRMERYAPPACAT